MYINIYDCVCACVRVCVCACACVRVCVFVHARVPYLSVVCIREKGTHCSALSVESNPNDSVKKTMLLVPVAGERGMGSMGKALHYKGSSFHRVIAGFMLQVSAVCFIGLLSGRAIEIW
jgi:hypothetical protein